MLGTALVTALCACRSSCPDGATDNLPRVHCNPVPLDQDGCLGLPGETVGPDAKRYPLDCTVEARHDLAQCGAAEYVCVRMVEGSPPVWQARVAL